jgi:hypothetical protein
VWKRSRVYLTNLQSCISQKRIDGLKMSQKLNKEDHGLKLQAHQKQQCFNFNKTLPTECSYQQGGFVSVCIGVCDMTKCYASSRVCKLRLVQSFTFGILPVLSSDCLCEDCRDNSTIQVTDADSNENSCHLSLHRDCLHLQRRTRGSGRRSVFCIPPRQVQNRHL